MKKLILTAACTALAALSGFSQGTIEFQNTVTTEFYLPNFSGMGMTGSVAATSADGIDVGLFYSTTAFNTIAGGTLAGIETIGTAAGQLAGNKSFTFGSVQTGDLDYYQVFAWDSKYGSSVAGLEACILDGGYFGASSAGLGNTTYYGFIGNSIALVAGVAPPAPGTPLFGTSGNVFGKTILLMQTPEPTTIALGGLGAAAMLLFRRRK